MVKSEARIFVCARVRETEGAHTTCGLTETNVTELLIFIYYIYCHYIIERMR